MTRPKPRWEGRRGTRRRAPSPTARNRASIWSSISSGNLTPDRPKNLIPLSAGGIMARGQHHAEIRVECSGEVRDAGGRDDAKPEHVNTGTRQSRDDGGLEEIAGSPRVTSDDGGGAARMTRQRPRRVPVRAPPRPPGPWQAGRSVRPQRPREHRQYRKFGPCRQLWVCQPTASAWSTEEPYGPS